MADVDKQAGDSLSSVETKKRTTRRKRQHRELRVVFDTNILFNETASDLLRREAANLINQSKYPDLSIRWYLPDVVRMERQFQMQRVALGLLAPLERVETLLGHKLNITKEILVDRVVKVIEQKQTELGLMTLKPDYASLDWERLVIDSAFRRAPFQDGKTEKGFRDALVVESFLHLVSESPKTAKVCRVVLVTADGLLTEAVQARIAGSTNVAVFASLEELRGLINTLVSEVDEAFLAVLRAKAKNLFFIVKDESTYLYKLRVQERLKEKFEAELSARPQGATDRTNGTWIINPPTFSKKSGQRVHWTSRIEIGCEATRIVVDESRTVQSSPLVINPQQLTLGSLTGLHAPTHSKHLSAPGGGFQAIGFPTVITDWSAMLGQDWKSLGPARVVTTHKGSDVYDVLWSVDVTMARDLRNPTIDDVVHVETTWEAVS
jgi:hypothetical protein